MRRPAASRSIAPRICRAGGRPGLAGAPGIRCCAAAVERGACNGVRQVDVCPASIGWWPCSTRSPPATEAGFSSRLDPVPQGMADAARSDRRRPPAPCPTDRMLLGAGLQHLISEFPSRMLGAVRFAAFSTPTCRAPIWSGSGCPGGPGCRRGSGLAQAAIPAGPTRPMSGNTGQARP